MQVILKCLLTMLSQYGRNKNVLKSSRILDLVDKN